MTLPDVWRGNYGTGADITEAGDFDKEEAWDSVHGIARPVPVVGNAGQILMLFFPQARSSVINNAPLPIDYSPYLAHPGYVSP